MLHKTVATFLSSLMLLGVAYSAEPTISIDLKEPVYEGGVIQGENIRVQAQEISYS